jgi:CRP-like cAMP-binding protein
MRTSKELAESGIFGDLRTDEIDRVFAFSEFRSLLPNETLIGEDDSGRDLYFIDSGLVEVRMRLPGKSGSHADVSMVPGGQFLGEFSFIDGARRSASIVVVEPSLVIRIPYPEIIDFFDEKPDAGYRFMKALAGIVVARIRNSNLQLRNAYAYL